MPTLQEYLAAKTPKFREKVQEESSQMALQYALAELRGMRNLSQREVAKKLQISQSAVSKIERHAMDVNLFRLVAYVSALGGKLSLQVNLPSGQKIVVPLLNLCDVEV